MGANQIHRVVFLCLGMHGRTTAKPCETHIWLLRVKIRFNGFLNNVFLSILPIEFQKCYQR